jgi:hypothetical protein
LKNTKSGPLKKLKRSAILNEETKKAGKMLQAKSVYHSQLSFFGGL